MSLSHTSWQLFLLQLVPHNQNRYQLLCSHVRSSEQVGDADIPARGETAVCLRLEADDTDTSLAVCTPGPRL